MANRYRELVNLVPKGSFYDGAGVVVPYRGPNPHEFLFSPVPASRTFAIYVNDALQGETTSDVNGLAVVSLVLGQGRQDIVLVDTVSGARFPAYVVVRVWATVMASHAEVVEGIDSQLDEVQQAFSVETTTSKYLEDVYGRPVQQPNNLAGWLTESYRRLVRWLRQAYRVFGSKLLGLRQVVAGFTASLPFRVPDAWRPRWVLGYQLMPNGDLQDAARLTASPLTNLNARSNTYVHASYGGVPPAFPGPFTQPPTAQRLQVRYSLGAGGDTVTVTGLDPQSNVIAEVFTLSSPPEVVEGLQVFASVTSAVKSAAGVTASIGIAEGRFLTVVSLGGLNTLTAEALEYSQTLLPTRDWLSWAGGPLVDISADVMPSGTGRVTLRSPSQRPRWYSHEDGNPSYTLGAAERFLGIEADGRGIVQVDLTEPLFAGGVSPRTPVQVATSINTYFTRDVRYGAVRATGSVTIAAATTGFDLVGDTITIGDGLNPPLVFEFLSIGPASLGRVLVLVAPAATAAQIAVALAAAINNGSRNGISQEPNTLRGLRVRAGIDAAAPTVVQLENDFGGVQGNVPITTSAGGDITPIVGMSGGVDAPVYSTVAEAEDDVNSLQNVVRLRVASGSAPVGPSASFRIHPIGADAATATLGLPLTAGYLTGAAVMRATSLALSVADRLPEVSGPLRVLAPFADDGVPPIVGAATLPRPAALEVYFDASWRAGAVTILGVSAAGDVVSEVFTPASSITSSGTTNASSVDGGFTVFTATPAFTHEDVGRFFRRTSGQGAWIKQVASSTVIRLDGPGIGNFASQSWTVTEGQRVVGSTLFASVTHASYTTVATAGPSGTAALFVRDAAARGYDVRLGRGLRMSGGAGADVLNVSGGGAYAEFDALAANPFLKSDVGGYVRIVAADAGGRAATGVGANNGLHKILAVLPTGGGLGTCLLQHQDFDRGGQFTVETLGGGASWQVYAPGELVRVIGKSGTTLDLYPPGNVAPRALGALVERADELPLTTYGWEGTGELVVDVDRTLLPGSSPVTDTLTVVGTVIPDGWRAYNVDTATGTEMEAPGQTTRARLKLYGVTTDVDALGAQLAIERPLPLPVVTAYRGFVLRASFWLQQHVDVSSDLSIDFAVRGGPAGASSIAAGAPAVLTDAGAKFTTSLIGQHVTIRNATTGANAGTFPIVGVPSATTLEYTNAVAVSEAFGAATTYDLFVLGDVVPGSTSSNPEAVPGTGGDYALQAGGPLDVHLVEAQVELPFDADRCIVRLTLNQGTAPAASPPDVWMSIEECMVRATNAQGVFLGENTVPRTAKRAEFGEVLYVWSSEALNASERQALGIPTLPASTPTTPGQIDYVTNAHGYWERFDVSEYSGSTALNVRGAYDEVAWSAATLANMEVVLGTPPRMTVVRPVKISLVEGERLNITAPSNAALAETSAHEAPFPDEAFTDERLFEDGLSVPATPKVTGGVLPWRFTTASAVQIASVGAGDPVAEAVFNSGSEYTVNYRRLTRVTPGIIDLGATFSDYLWLVDATLYRRAEVGSSTFVRTQQLTVLSNYQATLDVRSNGDATTATLQRDDGNQSVLVPAINWRFVDAQTVAIDTNIFDVESLYSLTYTALEPTYTRLPLVTDLRAPAGIVIEARAGATPPDVASAAWRVVAFDEVVDRSQRYHQLRATIAGVVNGRVQSGTGNALVNGSTVTLTSGVPFEAGVKVDRVFRILSGAAAGRAAHIAQVVNATRLTLDSDLGVFPDVDWEVRTFLHGTDVEIAGLGLRGINLYGSPPNAPGIIVP